MAQGIAVLAMSKRNSNAAEIILFLHRLTAVLVEYFKELEEESIRDNFVIIYELLDEMMDFGYPQTTESKILQEFVITSGLGYPVLRLFPIGTSLKNLTNLRSKCDHQWRLPMPYHGDQKAFDIGKTRCF